MGFTKVIIFIFCSFYFVFSLNIFEYYPFGTKYPEKPVGIIAYQVDRNEITIDGKLDEKAWQDIPFSHYFEDIRGIAKHPIMPRYQTQVKLLWTKEGDLLIGAYLQEPHLVAKSKVNHTRLHEIDNNFEIFINPSGNAHMYIELQMNALNTIWSLVICNSYREDEKQKIDPYPLEQISAVWLDGTLNDPSDIDKGWSVEVLIPWKVLQQFANTGKPKHGDQWRINFMRAEQNFTIKGNEYIKEDQPPDYWAWGPTGLIAMHIPEQWGFVQFSTEKPNTSKFVYNPASYDIPHILFFIAKSQWNYFAKNNRFATSYEELEITNESFLKAKEPPINITLGRIIKLDTIQEFDCSILYNNNGTIEEWHVDRFGKKWMTIYPNLETPENYWRTIIYVSGGLNVVLVITVLVLIVTIIVMATKRRNTYREIE